MGDHRKFLCQRAETGVDTYVADDVEVVGEVAVVAVSVSVTPCRTPSLIFDLKDCRKERRHVQHSCRQPENTPQQLEGLSPSMHSRYIEWCL